MLNKHLLSIYLTLINIFLPSIRSGAYFFSAHPRANLVSPLPSRIPVMSKSHSGRIFSHFALPSFVLAETIPQGLAVRTDATKVYGVAIPQIEKPVEHLQTKFLTADV